MFYIIFISFIKKKMYFCIKYFLHLKSYKNESKPFTKSSRQVST